MSQETMVQVNDVVWPKDCCFEHIKEQEALQEILLSTIEHFFGDIPSLFKGIQDPRNSEKITYPLASVAFAGVLMFLFRLGSRRQINYLLRNNGPSQSNFELLFGVDTFPHGDTLNDLFRRLCPDEVQESVSAMIETLIRKKVLYSSRLLDHYYVIAIDGTGMLTFDKPHCSQCLTRTINGKTTYYHNVLEAKLVTPSGFINTGREMYQKQRLKNVPVGGEDALMRRSFFSENERVR
jgi:hypothetical protein